jgi:hypothetical protein
VVGSTISVFWNLLQTTILSAAAVVSAGFAGVLKVANEAAKAVARLNGASELLKPQFDKIDEVVGGLVAVTEEFGKRATANGKEVEAAWGRLTNALSTTGDAASKATPAMTRLSGAAKVSADEAARLQPNMTCSRVGFSGW